MSLLFYLIDAADSNTLNKLDLHSYLLVHARWAVSSATTSYTVTICHVFERYLSAFMSERCSIWSESADLVESLVQEASRAIDDEFVWVCVTLPPKRLF